MQSQKYKGRFVIPVWGQDYIDVLARYAIPALLAKGNLPFLAERMDLELIFVTKKDSVDIIKNSETIQSLTRYLDIKFLFIDDFVSNNYGVVLTTAYFLAVSGEKETAKDYHYFFLNVDSIIANGSYMKVFELIEQGKDLIFAPGIRVNAPALFEELDKKFDPQNIVLEVEARELAEISLPNLHMTVLAQRESQKIMHLEKPYQFYWQDRPETLHIAQFLMANICFKPSVIPETPPCFVDYCIAEAFAPDAKLTILSNSDDFLLIEPQDPSWMMNEVHIGYKSREWLRSFFSMWMTKQHVELGQTICTVHSKDLQQSDHDVIDEAKKFVDDFSKEVQAQTIHNHPYWVAAMAGHNEFRAQRSMDLNDNTLPKINQQVFEVKHKKHICHDMSRPYRWLNLSLNYIYRHIPILLHFLPSFIFYRPIVKTLETLRDKRILVILPAGAQNWFVDRHDPSITVYKYRNIQTFIHSDYLEHNRDSLKTIESEIEKVDSVVIICGPADILEAPKLWSWVKRKKSTEGSSNIFCCSHNMHYLKDFRKFETLKSLSSHDTPSDMQVVGHPMLSPLYAASSFILNFLEKRRFPLFVCYLPILILMMPVILILNILSSWAKPQPADKWVASLLLTYRRKIRSRR